jgi:hypothetical protein
MVRKAVPGEIPSFELLPLLETYHVVANKGTLRILTKRINARHLIP